MEEEEGMEEEEEEKDGGGTNSTQELRSPLKSLFLLSLEQKNPLCLRTIQAIKISTKPLLLGKPYQSWVWGNAASQEDQGLTLDFTSAYALCL